MCLYPKPKAQYKGITDALIRIIREEGAFRPVRGMSVVAFGAGPAHALYFSCYEFMKRKLSGDQIAGDSPAANCKFYIKKNKIYFDDSSYKFLFFFKLLLVVSQHYFMML